MTLAASRPWRAARRPPRPRPTIALPAWLVAAVSIPAASPFATAPPRIRVVRTRACGANESCIFVEDLDGDLVADVEYCARTCDLLDQDCPGADIGCYPTRDGPVCAPIGAGDLPRQEGDYCEFANSCDVGLGCFFVSSDWFCLRVCDYFETGGPTCGVDEVCNRHEDDDWGVCVPAF
jgi:hypothetical protein